MKVEEAKESSTTKNLETKQLGLNFIPNSCIGRRILLFTQTVSLISKVNVENAPARVNLCGVS